MDQAIENDNLEVFKYHCGMGYKCDEYTASNAADHRSINIVKFLVDKGIFCLYTMRIFIQDNNMEMVQYIHNNKKIEFFFP